MGKPKIIERLDAFSAPRLVEYFDPDPCNQNYPVMLPPSAQMSTAMRQSAAESRDRSLGVTVEARFNVGEYDILILSAKESGGLETWLNRNGYKIPRGVFWLDKSPDNAPISPGFRRPTNSNVFITRLHVRYTRDKFPEDLMFQETSNRENFQGRYILQHPFTGETKCASGREYKRGLDKRYEQEAQTLAKLTNWNIQDIRQKMKFSGQAASSWWHNLFSWLQR